MSALLIGFCAASGGVVVGLLLGACLAAGKLRDLEAAYECLSQTVRLFLRAHLSSDDKEVIPVARQDFQLLSKSLNQADYAIGLAWPDNRGIALKKKPFP